MANMCNQNTLQLRTSPAFTKDGDTTSQSSLSQPTPCNGETPGRQNQPPPRSRKAPDQASASPTPTAKPPLTVFPAQAGIQWGRATTKPPSKVPSPPRERVRACPELAEGVRGEEITKPIVTHLNILNYEIAHLIRHETAEGHTVVRLPRGHHDRQGQAIHTQEVLHQARRPHGSSKRTPATRLRRPRLTPQAVRQHRREQTLTTPCTPTLPGECASTASAAPTPSASCSEVMSDPDPDLEFTIHHRMSAAQELLRRGWDTNHDNIKPKHLQDYWRDEGKYTSLHRPEEDPGRPINLHRRLRQLRRHRLRSHSQRDERRRRPRRQLKASSFPRDRPIFSPFLRKQESRRPRRRQSFHKAPSPSGRGLG